MHPTPPQFIPGNGPPAKGQYEPSSATRTQEGIIENRDANNIMLGSWETDLCGCFTHMVPNCLMVTCLPFISIGQIAHRLGTMRYSHVVLGFLVIFILQVVLGAIYFSTIMNAKPTLVTTESGTTYYTYDQPPHPGVNAVYWIASVIQWIMVWHLRTKVRERFRIPGSCCEDYCVVTWCTCCSIAQMASHVQSYKPKSCDFGPPDVLPAFDSITPTGFEA